MKRFFLAIVALLLIALPSAAQVATGEITAAAFSHVALQLTPAAPSLTSTVIVDTTPSFSIYLIGASQTLRISMVAPNGVRYTVGDPASAVFESATFPIDATPATRAGASYLMTLNSPLAGNWTLDVSETATLSAPIDLLVTTFINNKVRLVLAGGGETFPLGRNVRLALVAFDDTAKVSGLAVNARIFRPFDPTFAPQSVTFRDDGTGADETAADGIYQAFVNPGQPGDYQVQADVSGSASTGAFRRSTAATLRVVTQTALISGFTDRGIDDNFDGLFDRIGVSASANVSVAGDYLVTIILGGANGHVLQKSVRQNFGVGGGSAEVPFAASDIIRDLGVNGPYTVSEVRYSRITSDDVVPVDIRYDLGNTAPYTLGQLQHARLQLTGTGTATGVDFDANGRFDQLDIGLGVNADFAGFYRFSCSLTDSLGHELGFRTGFAFFNVGTNTLNVSFAGRPIGENGVDGPYFLSNLILFGAGQSLVATTAFTTQAFRARQFEGFILDTTPPVVHVTVTPASLWPPNHKLVEIVLTVTATDDFDPQPVVELASITSNQAANDRGDGNTAIDIVVENGRIFLRAERSGTSKDPRIYTITYKATDASGNVGFGSATVTVSLNGK